MDACLLLGQKGTGNSELVHNPASNIKQSLSVE